MHAARAHVAARAARHGFDGGSDFEYAGDEVRIGIVGGIGGIQAIDVGQQNQALRAHHLRYARRQPVVVPVADFRRRHGVVLIDHRHRTERQEGVQGSARVQIAAALFRVAQSQQNLRNGDFVRFQQFLVGVRQANLSHRRRRLALLQPELPGAQAQVPPPQGDGAGRDQDDLLAAFAQPRHVRRKSFQPGAIQAAFFGVHQQGRPDLDDHTFSFGKVAGVEFTVCGCHKITILPFTWASSLT